MVGPELIVACLGDETTAQQGVARGWFRLFPAKYGGDVDTHLAAVVLDGATGAVRTVTPAVQVLVRR